MATNLKIAYPNARIGAEGIGDPLTLKEWITGADDASTIAEVIENILLSPEWDHDHDFSDLVDPTIDEAKDVLGADPWKVTVGDVRRALRL